MKKLLLIISFAAVMSCAETVYGKDAAAKQQKPEQHREQKPIAQDYYRGSFGVLGGITMAGAQAEYTFTPYAGIRGIMLFIPGAGFNSLNRDEWILSAIITPVLHLGPELAILDPVLMLGPVYSYHHWETKASHIGLHNNTTIRQGNFHDVTFGAGIGFLFKFAGRFKTGLYLWLNYDYSVTTTLNLKKKKDDRIILLVPIIEFTVQF